MKFKAYLSEGYKQDARSKEIEVTEMIDLLKKNCKKSWTNFYKNDNALWRGHVEKAEFRYVEPSKHRRISAKTANYYTLWLDNNPKNKKYPKRSKSLICGNNSGAAYGMYDNMFVVLPFDGSDVGVCPRADFWYSFERTYNGQANRLNQDIKMLSTIILKNTKDFDNSWAEMKRMIDQMEKEWKTYTFDDKLDVWEFRTRNDLVGIMDDNDLSPKQALNRILHYDSNGFQLIKAGDTIPQGRDRECWTDGNSVLINHGMAKNQRTIDEINERVMG